MITLARDMGFEVREQTLPREMLYIADEVFFVGTAVEVTPIRTVDKVKVGPGRRGSGDRSHSAEILPDCEGRGAGSVWLDAAGWRAGRGCFRRPQAPITPPDARQRPPENRRRERRVGPAPESRKLSDAAGPRLARAGRFR